MKLKKTPIKYAIHSERKSPIFGENTIHVSVEDEGAGFFYAVRSVNPEPVEPEHEGALLLEYEELKAIMEICEEWENNETNN
jgi:hypothetical protein